VVVVDWEGSSEREELTEDFTVEEGSNSNGSIPARE
jgi:hypothetical protein